MIDLSFVQGRLATMLPSNLVEAVTLKSRNVGETGFASVTVPNARRVRNNLDMILALGGNIGEMWQTWHLLDVNQLTTAPKSGDRITDSSSVTWEVKSVQPWHLLETVAEVVCIKDR